MARVTGALLLTALFACTAAPSLRGRYCRGPDWIEFRTDGRVIHGASGDRAQFRVDGEKVVISDGRAEISGRIVDAATVEFPGGPGAVADAFGGRWVMKQSTPPGTTTGPTPTELMGEWGTPGDSGNLVFAADGTFRWGPTVNGTYKILDNGRVRMAFVQDGRPSGQMDSGVVIAGDGIRLTAPDGAVTAYKRVK